MHLISHHTYKTPSSINTFIVIITRLPQHRPVTHNHRPHSNRFETHPTTTLRQNLNAKRSQTRTSFNTSIVTITIRRRLRNNTSSGNQLTKASPTPRALISPTLSSLLSDAASSSASILCYCRFEHSPY